MPNSIYTYIFDRFDLQTHFVDNILNVAKFILCTLLNDFKHFYQIGIILFTFNHLFADGKTFLTIQISISNLFAHSLNV